MFYTGRQQFLFNDKVVASGQSYLLRAATEKCLLYFYATEFLKTEMLKIFETTHYARFLDPIM